MREQQIPKEEYAWYKLDNAAKLYPAIMNNKWVAIFRVWVELQEDIDPVLLQQALEKVTPRIQSFHLRLHRGMFWYYLESNHKIPHIQPDEDQPCMRMEIFGNNGYLFRVRYFQKRIALEVFHAIADGYGATVFLKTLTAEYLRLKYNISIPAEKGVLDVNQPPDPEEMEDAYGKYSKFGVLRSRKESTAYQVKGTPEPQQIVHIISGYMPLDKLLTEAKKYGLSLTEYLVSVYIYVLDQHQRRENHFGKYKEVKVSVPVNMRRFYPSKTLRNFSMYVNPGINPNYGEFTFEEIASQVHHFMRGELNDKLLNARMAKNVSSERNIITRVMPLFVKKWVLSLVYRLVGESRFTSTISNIGIFQVPDEMQEHIMHFGMMLGRQRYNSLAAAVGSYRNELCMTFTRGIAESDVIQEYFTYLVKAGIPVKVESNDE